MNDTIQRSPVARARTLTPAIEAAARTIEHTRRIPDPVLTALHESRLLRMLLPKYAGGDEIEPATYLKALIEIARADGSVAWNVFVGNSAAIIAAYLEAEIGLHIFSDPRAVIAWGPPNSHRARAVTGGYRVTGEWSFASGCRQANWMGAHCQVEESGGSLRLNRNGQPTVRTLLFPIEHAELIDNWNPIGLRGTASDGYTVDNVFVAEAYSTTREDPELRTVRGPLYAFTMQGLYAVGVAGVALGLARGMLDAFVALALEKTPRGQVRLADSANVQAEVARCEASIESARAWLTETLRELYASAPESTSIDVAARARVRLGSAHAIQNAIDVADKTYRLAGVSAIFPDSPFERRFRDMHTLSQQIQARVGHFESVGKVMFGVNTDGFL